MKILLQLGGVVVMGALLGGFLEMPRYIGWPLALLIGWGIGFAFDWVAKQTGSSRQGDE